MWLKYAFGSLVIRVMLSNVLVKCRLSYFLGVPNYMQTLLVELNMLNLSECSFLVMTLCCLVHCWVSLLMYDRLSPSVMVLVLRTTLAITEFTRQRHRPSCVIMLWPLVMNLVSYLVTVHTPDSEFILMDMLDVFGIASKSIRRLSMLSFAHVKLRMTRKLHCPVSLIVRLKNDVGVRVFAGPPGQPSTSTCSWCYIDLLIVLRLGS